MRKIQIGNCAENVVERADFPPERIKAILGKETVAQRLEIEWPRGKKQVLENVAADRVLNLDEANAH